MDFKRNKMALEKYYQEVPVEQIATTKWELKNIDKTAFKKLKNSIAKNGQTKVILVRELEADKFEIIDGRQVFKILFQLGVKKIHCCIFKNMTKIEAKLLYLEHDYYFENNFVEIGKVLSKLIKKYPKPEIEKTVVYNYAEIEELLKLQEFDFEKYAPIKISEQSNFF